MSRACASSELLRLQNYPIIGIQKAVGASFGFACADTSIIPVDETAITSVSLFSADFAHAAQMPQRVRIYPGYWTEPRLTFHQPTFRWTCCGRGVPMF